MLTQWELDEHTRACDPATYERIVLNSPTPEDVEPIDEGPLIRTTADLWTLLHDPTAWHDWPDPDEPTQP